MTTTLDPSLPAPDDTAPPPVVAGLRATVTREALLDALLWAGRSVGGRRAPMRVLTGVMLTAGRGGIVCSGFDYDTYASDVAEAPGATGRALVPWARLKSIVGVLPRGTVIRLATTEKALTLAVWTDEQAVKEFAVPLLPLGDYPVSGLPARPETEPLRLTGPRLAHLAKVCSAVGRDDTLPILTSVRIEREDDGGFTAATTDRYRLAVVSMGEALPDTLHDTNVPGRAVALLARAWRKAQQVEVYGAPSENAKDSGAGWVWFRNGDQEHAARLGDGEFPKYRSLLPTEHTSSVTAPAAAFGQATREVREVRARTVPLRLVSDADRRVRMIGNAYSGSDDDYSKVLVDGAEYTPPNGGDALRMAFNPQFMLDGINVLGGNVTCQITGPTRPIVMVSDAEQSTGVRYLLMPVRMEAAL